MSDERTVIEYIAGGVMTILTGIGLYHTKKINEIPEKFMLKTDFQEAKKEIREDIKEVKDSLEVTTKGIHDRLDKLFEPK